MILMNLEIDNLYAFKDFKINFSYPKKIVNSSIPEEHLSGYPNFRYKKVNILMGANASGKTTLGMALRDIFNFITQNSTANYLKDSIRNDKENAYFSVDIVLNDDLHKQSAPKKQLYRINTIFQPLQDTETELKINISIQRADIHKKDSYESAVGKLKEVKYEYSMGYQAALKEIPDFGWYFALTDGVTQGLVRNMNLEEDVVVYDKVLRSLDPDILSVKKVEGVENSFVIHKNYRDILVQEGEVIKNSKLSSGTIAGIAVAEIISAIKANRYGFYYFDEKFSYIHSELESAFILTMIYLLRSDTQLFITTHNSEILHLDLPKHSFTFLRADPQLEAIHPEDIIKKHDKSLYHAIRNDVFNSVPSTDRIFELLEDK